MLDFSYYLVIVYVKNDRLSYPNFITCAKTKTEFIRINDLFEFLNDGKSGLSDDTYDLNNTFIKIEDNIGWKNYLKTVNF